MYVLERYAFGYNLKPLKVRVGGRGIILELWGIQIRFFKVWWWVGAQVK